MVTPASRFYNPRPDNLILASVLPKKRIPVRSRHSYWGKEYREEQGEGEEEEVEEVGAKLRLHGITGCLVDRRRRVGIGWKHPRDGLSAYVCMNPSFLVLQLSLPYREIDV